MLRPLKVGDTIELRQRGKFVKVDGELMFLQPPNQITTIDSEEELARILEMAPELRGDAPPEGDAPA